VKDVGEEGSEGTGNAESVEPQRTSSERGSNGRKVGTEAQLQEQSGYADGGDHDQSDGTEERYAAGVEDDQR
jgi:hypothetical protein